MRYQPLDWAYNCTRSYSPFRHSLMNTMTPAVPKVAIIGSGISGLAALWALRIKPSHEVHLYESNDYLGGHTHTVAFKHRAESTMVDTGFIVLNTATYRS